MRDVRHDLGLDPQAPMHSGRFVKMAWFPFWTLATGLAGRD